MLITKLISIIVIGTKNCENNNPVDLAEKLLVLCKDEVLRKAMGQNSRKLAERETGEGSSKHSSKKR